MSIKSCVSMLLLMYGHSGGDDFKLIVSRCGCGAVLRSPITMWCGCVERSGMSEISMSCCCFVLLEP